MQIIVHFFFNGDAEATATTGVCGQVSDLILPCVGDVVQHRTETGFPVYGRVTERHYDYSLTDSPGSEDTVSVILLLDRLPLQ